MENCQKLKLELQYNPINSLLGIYQKEMKLLSQRDSQSHVHVALFTIDKKQPKCLSMEKENVISHTHTHTGTRQHYSAIRKKEILPFVMTWMKLEDIILWNKPLAKRQMRMISLCVESRKFKVTETEKIVVTRGSGVWWIGDIGQRVQTFSWKWVISGGLCTAWWL